MSVKHSTLLGTALHQPFKKGLDADKATSPAIGDWYLATDVNKLYVCLTAGSWVLMPDSFLQTIITAGKVNGAALTGLASIPSGAGKIPDANSPKIIRDTDSDTSINTEETADADTIVGKVAGVEALRIHTAGIMDLAKQSGCRARLSVNQTIATGTWTQLSLATKDWDIQNEFNTTTYRFTATKAGKYLVVLNGRIETLADGNSMLIAIYKNGALAGSYNTIILGAAGSGFLIGTDILSLNANDYIDFYIYHNYGASRTAEASMFNNYMVVTKIA